MEEKPNYGNASGWLRIYRRRFALLKEAVRRLGGEDPIALNLASACAEVASPYVKTRHIIEFAVREVELELS